jgi:uncharacterized protein (UPF0332 family)
MMAERNGYLAKAQENLRSATSDLAQGRYNSGARSAYYACFGYPRNAGHLTSSNTSRHSCLTLARSGQLIHLA